MKRAHRREFFGALAAGFTSLAHSQPPRRPIRTGILGIQHSHLTGKLQAMYGNVEFSPNSSTTVAGDDGGVAIGWIPGGSAFAVQKLNPDWRVGFGVLSYFGLAENYGDTWVGRYSVQKSTLMGLTLTPAVSYRVNNWLYLGAGLNMMYGCSTSGWPSTTRAKPGLTGRSSTMTRSGDTGGTSASWCARGPTWRPAACSPRPSA